MTTAEERFELFRERLKRSTAAVGAIASFFIRSGRYDVFCPRLHVPEDVDDRETDSGDLHITPENGKTRIVDAKGLNYSMEQINDFPMIVFSTVRSWDNKAPPDLVMVVDNTLTHAFMLDVSKAPEFAVVKIKDKEKDLIVENYGLPPCSFKLLRIAP